MTRQPTVLVIGGGVTGIGTARDLAARGVDVTLVERGGLASGTSGRSHGLLHSGARYAESDPEGAAECIAENRIIREIAGHCVDDTGGLFVQLAGDDPAYFEAKLAACREHGIDATVIDGDTARDRMPSLADTVERAMVVPDAVVYPSRLAAANAASTEAHGGTVLTDAPVTGMTVKDGRITGVDIGGTVEETINPAYVVNATGAWAGECAAMAGVTVEMQPTKGVMVGVDFEGVAQVLNRCREPADGDIIIPHKGHLILGTTSVAVDDPETYSKEQWEIDQVVRECTAMVPGIAGCPVARTYWGVRPLYEPTTGDHDRDISRGFVLLDHAAEGVDNFLSIVGGKLTTYRLMAEAVADHVCATLGVEADSHTATEQLPAVEDPDELDELVTAYSARSPADQDVLSR